MEPAAHSEATPTGTAELRASAARLRALFDATSQGVSIMKLVRDEGGNVVDARYVEVNPAFEHLTGLDRASVIGRRSSEVFPLDFARWQPRLADVKGTAGPERFETFVPDVGRWFSCYAAPLDGPDDFAVFFDDVSGRKQREDHQAFLLTLSDALRPLTDAAEIQQTAARVLGEHLGVIRAMYADVEGEPGAEVGILRGQYHRSQTPESGLALPPFPERYGYDGFGERVMALRRRGETMVVADVATDERFEAGERAAVGRGGRARRGDRGAPEGRALRGRLRRAERRAA